MTGKEIATQSLKGEGTNEFPAPFRKGGENLIPLKKGGAVVPLSKGR
jgi:hypothetical protein